jgi:tetratricopeptide (TPR) repeat protein
MGNWYANAENPQEAYRYHRKALEIFEQLEDQRGLAGTLDLLGMANTLSGDVHALIEYYDRAIALFRELDDQPNLASSLMIRSIGGPRFEYHAVVGLEPLEVSGDYLDQALQITLETDFRPGQCLAYWAKGLWLALSGQFGQALKNLQTGLNIATEIGHKQWMAGNLSGLGMVYGYLLAGERARSCSEQALHLAKEIRSQYWTNLSVGTLARALMLIGDPARGQEYLDDVLQDRSSMETIAFRYCWARYAELALAQHQPERALELIDQIISSIPGMEPGQVISSLWRLRGEALVESGKVNEAEKVMKAALNCARKTGEHYILWRIHANLGRLYQDNNREAEAANEFAEARRCVEKLTENIPQKELKEDFRTQAKRIIEGG